jgi:murein DD-endopeptidase MepM/ murein hydrolase activator NlpD
MKKRALTYIIFSIIAIGGLPYNTLFAAAFELAPPFSIVFPLMSPKISSKFGSRKHPVYRHVRHHSGVDLAAPKNSHVRAVASGQVIYASKHGGYGNLISLQHADGYTSLYGHLNEIHVSVGDNIVAGEVIGTVGATGIATGPHLHFEWLYHGKALDPLKVFPALASKAQG